MNAQLRYLITFFLIMSLILQSCSHKESNNTEQAQTKSQVTVIHPAIQNITEYIQLNGVTVFQKRDNIRANNTGYITSMKFKQGDFIKSGQLYCAISTKEQRALKSISSLDSSLIKFQKPLSVIANASGVISAINTLKGDYVSEGDVLAIVSETGSLVVQVSVPFEYNKYVQIGKYCEIILPDGRKIRTTITGVMPTVDAASQSQNYFIRLPNQSIPENLNVRIRIPYKQKNNLLSVPSSSVQTDEMQKEFWLMKIIDNSLALKVPVKIGLQNDSMTEIISDKISVADKIVWQGAYGLADSSLIIIEK